MKTEILKHSDVKRIIIRMAYQILENNFDEKNLIISAISGRGVEIGKLLMAEISNISKLKLNFIEIKFDKENPDFEKIDIIGNVSKLKGQNILIVDDVLNTGKTLSYALMPFIKAGVNKIQVAVLVDRNHKLFPIHSDFTGISLSTTIQEHVTVVSKGGKIEAYLS